jgi:hypothetical protein
MVLFCYQYTAGEREGWCAWGLCSWKCFCLKTCIIVWYIGTSVSRARVVTGVMDSKVHTFNLHCVVFDPSEVSLALSLSLSRTPQMSPFEYVLVGGRILHEWLQSWAALQCMCNTLGGLAQFYCECRHSCPCDKLHHLIGYPKACNRWKEWALPTVWQKKCMACLLQLLLQGENWGISQGKIMIYSVFFFGSIC